MPDFVRVTDTITGHHITVLRSTAEADASRYRILKQPALDANGQQLPPKFRVSIPVAEKAAPETTAPAAE